MDLQLLFLKFVIDPRKMFSEQIVIQTDGMGNKKQRFIKKQKIGSGGFAKCYMLINCRTEQKIAAKVINSKQLRDKTTHSKILQEIQLHRQLDHPHIVKFYDTFQFEDQIFMLMELCQNNTLKEFLKTRVRITQFQAKCYLHQIIQGVEYLHSLNIIHRDIKLGNLFLNFRMEVKIGDFGLSKQLKQWKERRFTTCGTPNYIAPEILKQSGHSFQADIWAIGIILFAMLFGKPPFQSNSVESTYRKIKNNNYQFPKQIPVSNQAKDLIKNILDPNPKTRITLDQIKKHPFLNKDIQKIPKVMPPYTISIPPQANFLRQYVNQKNMKLLVYPKKVNDHKKLYASEDDSKASKLGRVLSADKKMLIRLQSLYQQSKQISTLNRGRYLKVLRTQSLSKSSLKQIKGFRSAASIGTLRPKTKQVQPEQISIKQPKQAEEDINEIICYYDISEKYGIAYLLSNGNYGIVYNDHTSLTAISDPNTESTQGSNFIYYDKSAKFIELFPDHLSKKKQILKMCQKKLQHYRKNNIIIPYYSETYGKKYTKFNQGFVMKLSNGIMQFFWGADSITMRNYKWVRWRINQNEGEAKLSQKNLPNFVQEKMEELKTFLIKQCLNSKAKNEEKYSSHN